MIQDDTLNSDVGQHGSNNNNGFLGNSSMGGCFSSNFFQVPAPATVPGCKFDPLPPYILVGDKIFQLQTWLMRSLPGKLSEEQQIFNYPLSKASCVMGNAY